MTAAAQRNRNHVGEDVQFFVVPFEIGRVFYFDPQTSGGLLLSVSPDDVEGMMRDFEHAGMETTVSIIGKVAPKSDKLIRLF